MSFVVKKQQGISFRGLVHGHYWWNKMVHLWLLPQIAPSSASEIDTIYMYLPDNTIIIGIYMNLELIWNVKAKLPQNFNS